MNSLTFITGNLNKVKWTQKYTHIPLEHKKLDLVEIQSLNIKEVVEHKLKEAYRILQKPVLVEDTSLIFHSLGKLPGPFIKWFLQELGPKELCNSITDDNRTATAIVLFGMYDHGKISFFEGKSNGSIAKKPRGQNGFGWDSIFIPEGKTKTHAEMTDRELDKINIRRIALEKMKKELET
ncbi:MAG TPA: non-canonical purine NTP pyrophosphatase [Candidatus Sulfotelmatobacter sp.]|jgi:non-canonical purine NTP pyrophosphatase (RdgB/HAM1 family)|nr:non-canonical purine NTP pyrophosphatase [Candidatus Sulfotelmatobacter sp.]